MTEPTTSQSWALVFWTKSRSSTVWQCKSLLRITKAKNENDLLRWEGELPWMDGKDIEFFEARILKIAKSKEFLESLKVSSDGRILSEKQLQPTLHKAKTDLRKSKSGCKRKTIEGRKLLDSDASQTAEVMNLLSDESSSESDTSLDKLASPSYLAKATANCKAKAKSKVASPHKGVSKVASPRKGVSKVASPRKGVSKVVSPRKGVSKVASPRKLVPKLVVSKPKLSKNITGSPNPKLDKVDQLPALSKVDTKPFRDENAITSKNNSETDTLDLNPIPSYGGQQFNPLSIDEEQPRALSECSTPCAATITSTATSPVIHQMRGNLERCERCRTCQCQFGKTDIGLNSQTTPLSKGHGSSGSGRKLKASAVKDFMVELVEGSGVQISDTDLIKITAHAANNRRALVRGLTINLMGGEKNLRNVSANGTSTERGVPHNIKVAVAGYVSKHLQEVVSLKLVNDVINKKCQLIRRTANLGEEELKAFKEKQRLSAKRSRERKKQKMDGSSAGVVSEARDSQSDSGESSTEQRYEAPVIVQTPGRVEFSPESRSHEDSLWNGSPVPLPLNQVVATDLSQRSSIGEAVYQSLNII